LDAHERGTSMNWKLVLALAAAGPLIGAAVVFGLREVPMLSAWLVVRIASAIWIACALRARWFVHGFLVGTIGCACAVATKFLFFDAYVAHNPQYLDQLHETFDGPDPRIWIPVLAAIWALLHGIVQGALAGVAARFLSPRRSPLTPS
jgi:hypothetical protein